MKPIKKYTKNLSYKLEGGISYVKSYDTLVGRIDLDKEVIYELGKWSQTTRKHLKYVSDILSLKLIDYIPTEEKGAEPSLFNLMKGFLVLGDMDKDTSQTKSVEYKEKIIFATMRSLIPNWEKPFNWDDKTIEEKELLLKQVQDLV